MAIAQIPPIPALRTRLPPLRPESIVRERLIWKLRAADRPLTVVCAPAGYGKTTTLVQWLELSDLACAWLSLGVRDDDPRWFAARLLAALERALPGGFEAAERALQAGADLCGSVIPSVAAGLRARRGGELSIVLDDYHVISNSVCHELTMSLIDAAPPETGVVVATRTAPPLRLARRRTAGTVAEIGAADLRFQTEESTRLLNGSLALDLEPAQLQAVEKHAQGWAAGLALVAIALQGRCDEAGFADALAASQASLGAYVIEEVLSAARPQLQDFLRRTSILRMLSAPLCEALLDDPRARAQLDEVLRLNLFATAIDAEGTWARYHPVFAKTLAGELERREPELVPTLHRRACDWFERAGMADQAIQHALAADDGPPAAALLAGCWSKLIADSRHIAVRRVLDRLPPERGRFGPLCDALELLCMVYDGVDQRLTAERAKALAERGDDDPQVRLVLDSVLISPFYGEVTSAVEIGRRAWERCGDLPAVQPQIAVQFAFVLWFAGRHDEARSLLEPRLQLQQPAAAKVWTLAVLALTAADTEHADLAERYAREAMATVESMGVQTATAFTGVSWVLGEALRLTGKLEEARYHLSNGLTNEARRPGSVGHALALSYDAQLALSERDRERASASACLAREIVDRYPDLGTLDKRLAGIESSLERKTGDSLLGTEPTAAERRVLELLDGDRTLADIAADLYLSPHTVKSHVHRLYRRLGEHSRDGAIAAAHRRGLLADSATRTGPAMGA